MSACFCTQCGAPLVRTHVAGDAHERAVCSACARVSYQNPAIHVACIAHAPGAPTAMLHAPLAPNATLQRSAIAALGSPALGEEQLALYCTLTDLDAGTVCVVFRVLVPMAVDTATGAETPPAWAVPLLGMHANDCVQRSFPVRDGEWRDGALALREIEPGAP